MKIIAVSTEKTMFPTIIIPDAGEYAEYIQLTAGWNILVETGISLNINLDKPTRRSLITWIRSKSRLTSDLINRSPACGAFF